MSPITTIDRETNCRINPTIITSGFIQLSHDQRVPDIHLDPLDETPNHNAMLHFARIINCGLHGKHIKVHVLKTDKGWHCTITPANGTDLSVIQYLRDHDLIQVN
ncbi:MAG: hypothetical protein ABH884_01600 [Candidatus Komeilibacteria bacterium]